MVRTRLCSWSPPCAWTILDSGNGDEISVGSLLEGFGGVGGVCGLLWAKNGVVKRDGLDSGGNFGYTIGSALF